VLLLLVSQVRCACEHALRAEHNLALAGVALAHGWALAALAGMFGKLSGGHFNPAVTLMMVLTKQMPGLTGGFYVVAQVFGASAASAFCGA
jgi:aquaporin Z